MSELIRCTLDDGGVLVASIDLADRTMNVFSAELMDALDALMQRVETDPAVRSCVLTSGKKTFLAGADLVMVRGYCEAARHNSHAAMFELCGRLGRQFVRLEESAKPWVAAVNGLALGGGLELALACRVRVVADDPRIQLGVPEVRWGLLPGAGGTQRLPRLAGFEPALDLLLSGRSINPAEAVRLGLFACAVPPAALLETAKDIARSLHGQPYAAAAKFSGLAQTDVPAPGDAAAHARRHGIAAETFERFPAYGAIVDSVLLGARLGLAEATAVEMNQFLRLMFDPVAGRMVRTLFLERLRAERELAPPAAFRIESLALGEISPERQAWADALARLKLPQAPAPQLGRDEIEIVDAAGGVCRIALGVLDDAAFAPHGAGALLAPAGPYGRVIEVIGSDANSRAAVAALAQRLGALPWPTPGPDSALQRLRGLDLDAQALAAARIAAEPGVGDPVFIDVAACLAGIAPAWSGGPLSWGEAAAGA